MAAETEHAQGLYQQKLAKFTAAIHLAHAEIAILCARVSKFNFANVIYNVIHIMIVL